MAQMLKSKELLVREHEQNKERARRDNEPLMRKYNGNIPEDQRVMASSRPIDLPTIQKEIVRLQVPQNPSPAPVPIFFYLHSLPP
jgi:hypothetical protein